MSANIKDEVKTALSDLLPSNLKQTLDDLRTTVTGLAARNANAEALAKKSELDALVAEASRDGKTIPLDADDIYTVKDGAVTIKTEPSMLRKMIDKLPKAQVQFKRREIKPPTKQDGTLLDKNSAEFRQFCQQKREEGAAQLTQKFADLN